MKYWWAMKSKHPLLLWSACVLVLLAAFVAADSNAGAKGGPSATIVREQSPTTADASSAFGVALREIVAAGRLSDLRWPDFSDYKIHVANFYDSSGYAPAWLRKNDLT